MNKHRVTTANNNNNNINMIKKNIFHTSLPTVVNISNDDSPKDETDRFLNERGSSNILFDLPDPYNLEERDENELPFPGFVEKAFYCLRQTTPPRYQCLKLITWPWFERISMLVILLNCITLGMHQPCAHHTGIDPLKKCDTALCIWLQATDNFVFAFFTIEMCIKMTAMGIFGKGTYLAESWNRLDCVIVLTGVVELLIPGDSLSLSAIRTVRVLRPLRAINRIPSMRILVMLLLDTLPMLGNVFLLCFFTFFIFGVIGVQLWKGLLRNRCFLQLNTTIIDNYTLFDDFPSQSFYIPPDQDSFICSNPSSSGMTKCSEIPQYRRDNMTCELDFHSLNFSLTNKAINGCINWNQYYNLCAISNQNPFSGSISFDNIILAWLAIFQIITFENWVSIMYYIQDAHSFWNWMYFVCLIVIGSFFMMNLCLVVISAQFGVTKKRETERMLAEQRRFSLSTTSITINQQGSCWEEIIKYFQRLLKRAYKRFRIFWKNHRQKHGKVNQKHHRKVTRTKKVLTPNALSSSNVNMVSSTPLINQNHRPNCRYHQSQSLLVPTPLSKSIDRGTDTCDIRPDVIAPTSANNNSFIEKNRQKNEHLAFERQEQQIERNDTCDCYYQDEIVNISDNNREEEEEEEKSKCRQRCKICCCPCFTTIHKLISRFVASKYFDRIIFSAIIINTLSMAIEYHGQSQSLTNVLEYSNYVFVILFILEMLFKIIAEGCLNYIKNPFNVFDGGIIVISLIELYGTKTSGLSVLRTFRLLRVLKLVRFMPTLRRQLVVLLKTLDSVAAFLLLLLLFVFIFSILGMHLFGGEFCTLEAFNRTSREQIDMKCRCCACAEWNLLKNSTDLKDLTCIQDRANFDSFRFALLTVFQILTQEDWNEVLYNGMKKTSPWSALYFIALMIFGNYILLNLLVAIVVESYSNAKEDGTTNNNNNSTDRLDKADPFTTQAIVTGSIEIPENLNEPKNIKLSNDDKKNDRRPDTLAGTVHRTNSDPSFPSSSSSSTRYFIVHEGNLIEQKSNNITNTCLNSTVKRRSTIDNSSNSFNQNVLTNINQTPRRQEQNDRHTESNTSSTIQTTVGTQLPVDDQNNIQLDVSAEDDTQLELTTQKSGVIQSCLTRFCGQRIFECLKKRENYSLYLFSPSNRLRKVFQRLIVHKSFDYLILFFIILNCITFAMERPSISPISFERQFLNYSNYIFTAIFTIEMIIKVIANGLIFGSNTYLHTGWNVMDGFLVIISLVDLGTMHRRSITSPTESDTTSHILGMLRVFRLLRTLRALTVIHRAPGLKLVAQALLASLKQIGHIVIICCVVFVIFGILGVQLFKGKFYYCEGPLARNVTTRQQCEAMSDHQWQNQQYNFDHLGQALLTLFILSSKDGWVQIMYNGIDAVDVDMQPIRNYNEAKLIYFISFILSVSFFVLNMFVGVVIENFHNCRAQQELDEEVQNKAKRAKKLERKQRLMRELPYYAHYSSWRKCLHDLCINKYFDLIIAAIIGINVLTMSLEFYPMPSNLDKFLEYCNYVFTVIFLLEFIWKIIALGPSRYFKDKWNQLDSIIVLFSIVDLIMAKMLTGHILSINPTLIRVIRVLRIARVLKLLKMAKGIQALLDTVVQALPQVGNLGLLFLLLFFIFATLGVELFGKLECSEEQPCSGLSKHAHFKNFGIALLTLFRVATGDNWNGIMKDTLRPDNSPHGSKNHFMTIISPIYFIVFVLAAQFVLVNVVVAVLMKNLEDSNKMIADDVEMNEEIERQLELDVYDENYVEQSLIDVNGRHVKEKVTFTKL
ncbi:unnamed protein product [Rotaria sordida]|uniref:Voltage-dependent T-type calcium channel subunit alpha n=2 Tax=Rotaria sordida TaxID=392033 RepID=A0A814M3K4_9BILA|nr:unnamed protein product [Rotaria sordida]